MVLIVDDNENANVDDYHMSIRYSSHNNLCHPDDDDDDDDDGTLVLSRTLSITIIIHT